MVEVYLGLGSNMGRKRHNLDKALEMIASLPSTRLDEVSSYVESEPQGFWASYLPHTPANFAQKAVKGSFVNCCCRIETDLAPLELLSCLKGIEKGMGRTNEGVRMDTNGNRVYSDRVIDIDILTYADMKIDLPELTIPHPRMHEREFVEVPMRELLSQDGDAVQSADGKAGNE